MDQKKGFIAEFKEFIMRGNVMDLAVGVVVGGAFTAIVNALVECIINPIIGTIMGGVNFNGVVVGMFPIGQLIMAIINFLCVALVVFCMVKAVNRLSRKKKEEPAAPPAPPEPTKEELLLTEIRDLLKDKK